jgi:hypothetical protein
VVALLTGPGTIPSRLLPPGLFDGPMPFDEDRTGPVMASHFFHARGRRPPVFNDG